MKKHGIAFHEKTLGQLFCDTSARDIINMLLSEMAGAELLLEPRVKSVRREGDYIVDTSRGEYAAPSLVIACGGLSIPTMGATGLGYDIARQFGLDIIPTRAALVPRKALEIPVARAAQGSRELAMHTLRAVHVELCQ